MSQQRAIDCARHRCIMKVRDLSRTLLRHSDLSEATDARSMSTNELVKMIKSGKGKGANLQGVDLMGENLRDANLQGANLKGASLRYAKLRDVNLEGANLEGANLEWTDLRGANFQGANLKGVNLTQAYYDFTTEWPRGFTPPPSS